MFKVTFVLAAAHKGRTAELWRVVRHPDRFVSFVRDRRTEEHHTWYRSGHPHFTPETGSGPRRPFGYSGGWDTLGYWAYTTGIGSIYPRDLPRFPELKPRPRFQVTVAHPQEGQGVSADHYLVRPSPASEQRLAAERADPRSFAIWECRDFEPWSVIVVGLTEPGAVHYSG